MKDQLFLIELKELLTKYNATLRLEEEEDSDPWDPTEEIIVEFSTNTTLGESHIPDLTLGRVVTC